MDLKDLKNEKDELGFAATRKVRYSPAHLPGFHRKGNTRELIGTHHHDDDDKTMKQAKSRHSKGKVSTGKSKKGTRAAAARPIKPVDLKIRKVLAPVDFSTSSRHALRHAIAFASRHEATLILLHVVEPVVYPADLGYPPMSLQTAAVNFQDAAKARLQTLVEEEIPESVRVESRIKVGRPYLEITDLARKEKVDLLVISTHGYTGLKHVLLGSTAERVVRHADCPVLVVRRRSPRS